MNSFSFTSPIPNKSPFCMKHSHPTKSILKPIVFLLASLVIAQGADSDFDGLDDAVETNTGVYVSTSDTGTNPNAADTDGDGVPDGLEVKEKTSPVDETRFNSFSKGLVAYYPFNGGAMDASGNGHQGSEQNISYTSNRFANSETSAKFSTSSSVEVPTLSKLNFRPATYTMWLKLDDLPQAGYAFTIIGRTRTWDGESGGLLRALRKIPCEAS
jgi:hypothetical protein